MQEQMNSMNNSGDFQDLESNCSGRLSHVSGQPEVIPSSSSMLSRDKRLPLKIWNSSGLQGNVFGDQISTFGSPGNHSQRISSSDDVQRSRDAIPLDLQARVLTSLTSEDGQHCVKIPMSIFASRPLTTSSQNPVDIPQIYVVGQQRQQTSELQFDWFPKPSSFRCRKQDSAHRSQVVLIFKRWSWLILWMS